MSLDDANRLVAEVRELQEALKIMYDLLEDCAPSWYTEEYHTKVEAVLRIARSDKSKTP